MCVRVHLSRQSLPIPVDDVAMHVVSLDQGGPLEADEGGKTAGLVVILCGIDDHVPGGLKRLSSRQDVQRLIQRAVGKLINNVHCRFHAVLPTPADLVGEFPGYFRLADQDGIGLVEKREQAHVVGVIRDHQEVQGARQLRLDSGGGRDLLSAGETIRIFGP